METPPFRVEFLRSPICGTISQVLQKELLLSQYEIHFLMRMRSVYHNDQRIRHDSLVFPGDLLRVHLDPKRFLVKEIDWEKVIHFENENFIIADKPPGVPVHASVDNAEENILQQLSNYRNQDLFITQRLDVATQGLFLLAKTKIYQSKFNELLRERAMTKIYQAIVERPLEQTPCEWLHYMEPTQKVPRPLSTELPAPHWQDCRLIVRSQTEEAAGLFKLDLQLLTGRTHQIRSQLAFEGRPIVGDFIYGSKRMFHPRQPPPGFSFDAIGLRCTELSFCCPLTSKVLTFNAPSWYLFN